MSKTVALLCVAMLMVSGATAHAGSAATAAPAAKASMADARMLAPDEVPNHVVRILRTTDKAQVNSYVPVVFPLYNVNPFSVIRFLRRPVQTEEGLIFTFVNPDGQSGLVLYAVPQYMVDSLRDLVKAVDRPGLTTSASDARIYRQLLHRRVNFTGTTSAPSDSFPGTIGSFLTGDGSKLIGDPTHNAVYFADAASGAANLDAALTDSLDKPTAMIQLIVKVYELNAQNDGTLGLDYIDWWNGPGANLFALGGFAEHGAVLHDHNGVLPPLGTGAAGLPRNNFTANGYNFAYQYNVPSAFFDFLAEKGKARVMTETKLAALNNYSASLSTGDQILYYKTNVNTAGLSNGVRSPGQPFDDNQERTVTPEVLSKDATMDVSVTPHISQNNVNLALSVCWGDFNGLDDLGVPQVTTRKLTSQFRCAIGDEVTIGGLDRMIKITGSSKMPWLGSLPILGYAFGGETHQTQHSQMVISIQPVGIMKYDVAQGGDYLVDPASASVIEKANDNQPVAVPPMGWGFDQKWNDPERGITDPMGKTMAPMNDMK